MAMGTPNGGGHNNTRQQGQGIGVGGGLWGNTLLANEMGINSGVSHGNGMPVQPSEPVAL